MISSRRSGLRSYCLFVSSHQPSRVLLLSMMTKMEPTIRVLFNVERAISLRQISLYAGGSRFLDGSS